MTIIPDMGPFVASLSHPIPVIGQPTGLNPMFFIIGIVTIIGIALCGIFGPACADSYEKCYPKQDEWEAIETSETTTTDLGDCIETVKTTYNLVDGTMTKSVFRTYYD